MKKFQLAFFAVLIGALIGVVGIRATGFEREGVAGAQQAGDVTCSAASMKGKYSMAGQGFLARVPFAFVGILEFDGVGTFKGRHEESIGGNYGPSTEAGDYSVGPDCMGITHWTDHPPHTGLPPHNHTIVFSVGDGGDKVSFLGIDNSPPGQFHNEIPEPDIEFWGTLTRI